ncbi:UNC-76 protein [Aphelenchoides avenae]|nr:UNC-76 protein [Aphelenchus avenae]
MLIAASVEDNAAASMGDAKDLAVPDVPLAQIDDEDLDSNAPTVRSSPGPEELCKSGSTLEGSGSLGGSLSSLVEAFDEKVNRVLKDLDTDTQQMAPVQVRTQDEIMSESQVWWTLTGNYGNILPLDFNKTQIRHNQIEALNLQSPREEQSDAGYDPHEEDELRQSMDLHTMISDDVHINGDHPPVSADQVIEEIDEILQTSDLIRSMTTDRTVESVDSMYSSMRSPFTASSSVGGGDYRSKTNGYHVPIEELNSLSQSKLMALSTEMENLIQAYNADLVTALAQRDEMEYEKEVKNKFITLLLDIQDQRRKFTGDKKRRSFRAKESKMPQYMSATIPFDDAGPPLEVKGLESLIKILQAIKDDDPQVPSLLTEYILQVVCPSATSAHA